MNRQKYLYALLICLSIAIAIVPKVAHSLDPDGCNYNPEVYQGLEVDRLSQELKTNGLIGRIHGAASPSKMFVMSVREPDNFFSHREFSLVAAQEDNLQILSQTNRHDLVCVSGDFIANSSPQKHIMVNTVRVVEPWTQPEGFAPYERKTEELPAELKQQTSLTGIVHAIGEEGKILVVGYKGGVIPIFVEATEYTKDLYRGDIIKLAYKIQAYPQQPSHLKLDTEADRPLEVQDAIASWNNKPQTLSGSLVKFPQSPQLKFDVYAMEVDTQGIKRYFTLINFEDMDKFTSIRQKLSQIWDENLDTAVSGRNMLINPQVTIEARGIANIISPEQANPQILLDSVDQVKQIS